MPGFLATDGAVKRVCNGNGEHSQDAKRKSATKKFTTEHTETTKKKEPKPS